jgi:putative ATPase
MKSLDYGKGYLYPHDYPNHWVAQQYLPDALQGTQVYVPAKNARESRTQEG